MDEFLEALLDREAMPGGTSQCRHCDKGMLAVWRCKDCLLGTSMCRGCMRLSHRENPLHRIEQWNGSYFRPAELWEVGTYLLVKHHVGERVCNTLEVWCNFLEQAERSKDTGEQQRLLQDQQMTKEPEPEPEPDHDYEKFNNEETEEGENDVNDDEEDTEDTEEPEEFENTNPYLPGWGADAGPGPGPGSAMPGSYVRVVHSNGLHHIAMVSCLCGGEDVLPLDLVANRLIPASFK